MPTIINVGLRILTIPLTTAVLDPEHFGLFGLMIGVIGVLTAVSGSFTNLVITHRCRPGKPAPRGLVSSLVSLEVGAGLLLAILLPLVWHWMSALVGWSSQLPLSAIVLAALSIPVGRLWLAPQPWFVMQGNSSLYAVSQVLQTTVYLAVTLVALYEFDLGVVSLFAGHLGALIGGGIVGVYGMRREWSSRFDFSVLTDIRALGLMPVVSNLVEGMQAGLNRAVLGQHVGAHVLGLYVHSQTYRGFILTGAKALQSAVKPVLIQEAEEGNEFSNARKTQASLFGVLTVAGLGAALIGREIIGWLTHGKFADSAEWVPIWCIAVLVQNMGQPELIKLLVHGHGRFVSLIKLASALLSLVALFVLVPHWGVWGAIFAFVFRDVMFRGLIWLKASTLWGLRFFDNAALVGIAVIALITVVLSFVSFPFTVRLSMCVVFSASILPAYVLYLKHWNSNEVGHP